MRPSAPPPMIPYRTSPMVRTTGTQETPRWYGLAPERLDRLVSRGRRTRHGPANRARIHPPGRRRGGLSMTRAVPALVGDAHGPARRVRHQTTRFRLRPKQPRPTAPATARSHRGGRSCRTRLRPWPDTGVNRRTHSSSPSFATRAYASITAASSGRGPSGLRSRGLARIHECHVRDLTQREEDDVVAWSSARNLVVPLIDCSDRDEGWRTTAREPAMRTEHDVPVHELVGDEVPVRLGTEVQALVVEPPPGC